MSGWTAVWGLIVCFIAATHADTNSTCELSPYKPVASVREVIAQLQAIIQYCEREIGEMETERKRLESLSQQTERKQVQFSQEKRAKEEKVKGLNELISKVQKEVNDLQYRISETSSKMRRVEREINDLRRRIADFDRRIYDLRNSIRGKQDHIDALNRKIARERSKRRCDFRKRRSVPEGKIRKRRGWGPRIRFRRLSRRVSTVFTPVVNTGRRVGIFGQCLINNIVSRLTKAKEKAERQRNDLKVQLRWRQNDKDRVEYQRRRLLSQKNYDSRHLTRLNNNLRSMRSRLSTATATKVHSTKEIDVLRNHVERLEELLQRTDQHLVQLREKKTKVVSILSQLQTIRSDKFDDHELVSEAGEDIDDILEDEDTNGKIKKSVDDLIDLTCTDH